MQAIAELCARADPDISSALAAFRCSGIYFEAEDEPPDRYAKKPRDHILPRWNDHHPRIAEGSEIVNGVALPQNVIDQLRMLGISIAWYTQGELEEAVEACAFDGTLIDDDEGIDFRDRLHRTESEKDDDYDERMGHRYRLNMLHVKPWDLWPDTRYRDKLIKERERKRELTADNENHDAGMSGAE